MKNIMEEFKDLGYIYVHEIPKDIEKLRVKIKNELDEEDDDILLDTMKLADIIIKWNSSVVLLWKFLSDKKSYSKLLEYIYSDIKEGFEFELLRKCAINFKFTEDGDIFSMELRHFITQLMLLQGFCDLDEIYLDESYLIDCNNITAGLIKEYFDEKIIIPFRHSVSNKKMNIILHDILHNLSRISLDFNMLMGLTIHQESFMELAKRNERFNEIIRTTIPEDMQPFEIEQLLNELTKEQESILATEDNVLKPMILSKSGIKDKQRCEFMINGGLKPNLNGKTVPIVINTNLLIGGLRNLTNYYIDSLGGKKSLLMNNKEMGRSGHFARKVNLACSSIYLEPELEDCGTLNPTKITIKTMKHLMKLQGRYYRTLTSREYKILTIDDTHLLNKDILLRTPITCASDNVCKKCYGKLSEINKDIRIGTYGATKISEPLSQNILSTKHQLSTDSVVIQFENEMFDKLFSVYGNIIVLNVDDELDPKDFTLILIKKNVVTIEEFEDSEFNQFTSIFHVRNDKTGDVYEFIDVDGKDLFLTESIKESLGGNGAIKEVKLSELEQLSELFVLEIENNELTRPLFNLMHLMERKTHDDCYTIEDMVQRMLDLLIVANIPAVSVHGELMLYPLIRSSDNIMNRPMYNKFITSNDYEILTLAKSLTSNPSLTISLSSQELKRQLINPLTFKKVKASSLDPFYKENL